MDEIKKKKFITQQQLSNSEINNTDLYPMKSDNCIQKYTKHYFMFMLLIYNWKTKAKKNTFVLQK